MILFKRNIFTLKNNVWVKFLTFYIILSLRNVVYNHGQKLLRNTLKNPFPSLNVEYGQNEPSTLIFGGKGGSQVLFTVI